MYGLHDKSPCQHCWKILDQPCKASGWDFQNKTTMRIYQNDFVKKKKKAPWHLVESISILEINMYHYKLLSQF